MTHCVDVATQVNVAVVVDGSGSIVAADWETEKEFAKKIVDTFDKQGIFENGGSASYVQFSSGLISWNTATSVQDFNHFVDGDIQAIGSTYASSGIEKAQELLDADTASAKYMVVVTDGQSMGTPGAAADKARNESGIRIFSVGVGEKHTSCVLTVGCQS